MTDDLIQKDFRKIRTTKEDWEDTECQACGVALWESGKTIYAYTYEFKQLYIQLCENCYKLSLHKIKDEAKREAGKLNKKAIEKASKKLRRLRLTDVFGEKDIPQETVKSVFQRGLGGLYEDEAIVYVLRFGIKYYLDSLKEDGGEGKR